MIEQKKTATVQNRETSIQTGEEALIGIMNQSLEGVMFHSFEVDLYDLLRLDGFKKMHEHQVEEESCNLEKVKHKYIETYRKIPVLTAERKSLWKEKASLTTDNITHEKAEELVKESMKAYCEWETEVLEHLMKIRRDSKDKCAIHKMVKDVMEELEFVEAIVKVLEERDYSYDSICEMSDYLYRKC